jgi:hypothetical protein
MYLGPTPGVPILEFGDRRRQGKRQEKKQRKEGMKTPATLMSRAFGSQSACRALSFFLVRTAGITNPQLPGTALLREKPI